MRMWWCSARSVERFRDTVKLAHVHAELAALTAARDRAIVDPAGIADLAAELRGVNEAIWTIADRLRECERTGDFGAEFATGARSEYRNTDRRAAIKRQINERLRSESVEEKSDGANEAAEAAR